MPTLESVGVQVDSSWTPAQLPEESNLTQRRQLRVRCGFMVRLPGDSLVATYGDISAGGAKFTVDGKVGTELEILAGEHSAQAKVLEVKKMPGAFMVRVQFLDEAAGSRVFDEAFWAS